MPEEGSIEPGEPRVTATRSGRAWFYAAGFVGLALAVVSIADMFSPRPNDGIVPMPYSRGGIEVRSVESGGPAQAAGIRPGDRLLTVAGRPAFGDWYVFLLNIEIGLSYRVEFLRDGHPIESVLFFRNRPAKQSVINNCAS